MSDEFYKTDKFRSLQKQWYSKLKKQGFRDIERGRDLNEIPASTLKGGFTTPGEISFVSATFPAGAGAESQWDALETLSARSEYKTPADTPRGELWRTIGILANDYLGTAKEREILCDIAMNGCVRRSMLKRMRVTREEAMELFRGMLSAAKLPTDGHLLGLRSRFRDDEEG